MSTPPTPLENAVNISQQYAHNVETLDPSFLTESSFAALNAEIYSTLSYFPEELKFLLQFLEAAPSTWAQFFPPQDIPHFTQIFSYGILPSLGTLDALEEKRRKLTKKQERHQRGKKQQEKLSLFLQTLNDLNRDLEYINNHRSQYHKG